MELITCKDGKKRVKINGYAYGKLNVFQKLGHILNSLGTSGEFSEPAADEKDRRFIHALKNDGILAVSADTGRFKLGDMETLKQVYELLYHEFYGNFDPEKKPFPEPEMIGRLQGA